MAVQSDLLAPKLLRLFNWQGFAAVVGDSHEILHSRLSQLPGQAFNKGSQGRSLVSQMAI